MKEWIKDVIQVFIKSDISTIKDYTLKFAKQLTRAILDNDNEELEQLIDASCEIRDNIEMDGEIDRNKEFYYGYWYAYENIANRIVDHNEANENIHQIIDSNEKLRTLVKFLGREKAARQKDIAEYLDMKSNELANFMQTDYMKKVDILSKDKVGRNVIYSLNAKGRKYFKNQTSETLNAYSKVDILKILDYLKENKSKRVELLVKESPGLDEVVIKEIYNLIIGEEVSVSSKQKKKMYFKNGDIKKEDYPFRKDKASYYRAQNNAVEERNYDLAV